MAVEAQMHMTEEETYELDNYDADKDTEFWVLTITQEDGSRMMFYSHDAFDNFVKKVTELWANGGVKIG